MCMLANLKYVHHDPLLFSDFGRCRVLAAFLQAWDSHFVSRHAEVDPDWHGCLSSFCECPHHVRSLFPAVLTHLTNIHCIAFGACDGVHQGQHRALTSWCQWSGSNNWPCSRTPCCRCTGKSGSGARHTRRSIVVVLPLLVVLLVAARYVLICPSGVQIKGEFVPARFMRRWAEGHALA